MAQLYPSPWNDGRSSDYRERDRKISAGRENRQLQMVISIANNGAGSGEIVASLPFIAAAQGTWDAIGREDAVNGKTVHGLIRASQSNVTIGNYDNTYPGVNGASISVSGTYEAA